ncbi:TMV resistance protein N-like protein [Tanacetum coccineum]|uniref:TMV resistance protein N-like protein n=1 Tax=Tanacetum coccineum TaxID=301880 RepID=A0ABQ5DZJ3_9ASTR
MTSSGYAAKLARKKATMSLPSNNKHGRGGGQLGGELLVSHHTLFNKNQVFDSSEKAPDKVLAQFISIRLLEKLNHDGDSIWIFGNSKEDEIIDFFHFRVFICEQVIGQVNFKSHFNLLHKSFYIWLSRSLIMIVYVREDYIIDCFGWETITIYTFEHVYADLDPEYIGIESYMKKLNSELNIENTGEVRTKAILGMGEIGKTTIAPVLFRRISYKFMGSSFVKDVRENSFTPKDIGALQEKIIRDILGEHDISIIHDPDNGADMIQEKLRNKKVLIVLDDVDDFKQLEFLAESNEWCGSGSRILITTRNEQLLSDANSKYKPPLLTKDQALEQFSRHTFQENSHPEGYIDVSNCVIRYTGHLPLAVKVLGSFFHGRQASVSESALDRLAKIPIDKGIFDTLKLSFDNLNGFE